MRKALLSVFIFSIICCFGMANAAETEKKAAISFLKGDVKVQFKDKKNLEVAKLGMSVQVGDKIETKAESRTELKMEDGTSFRIGENSSVVIQEFKEEDNADKITLQVFFGRIWMNIKKSLEGKDKSVKVVTPTVTATVKGTTYRADIDNTGDTKVDVYDGTVQVTKDGKDVPVSQQEQIDSKDFNKTGFNEDADAKDEWVRWNKSRDKLRVMIVFTERKNGEIAAVPISEVVFGEELIKHYLFSVIDQSQLEKIRSDEKVKAALKGDANAAAAAGLEFGADMIITGQVDTEGTQPGVLAGGWSGVADMTVKVVRCDTAEMLVAKNNQARFAPDSSQMGAVSNAIRKASGTLVQDIYGEIVKKWKKQQTNGEKYDIILIGADFNKVEQIKNALAQIGGLKNPQTISLVRDRSMVDVDFVSDSLTLAQKINELNIKDIKLDVVGLTMNRLEVEVK